MSPFRSLAVKAQSRDSWWSLGAMLLTIAALAWQAGAALECPKPVEKAPVTFPKELLNDFSDERMFSGYINVTDRDFLFYWFVEAKATRNTRTANVPVILWSNGGPGCTSMEGATTEIGPLLLKGVKTGDGYSGRLSSNPFAWNHRAHIIFVDQPRYVGYSTGSGPFVLSSKDAAADIVQFIRGWRRLFPQFANSKFVLASESYGGHYVPAWAEAILEFNRKTPSEEISVAGVVLSNTCIDQRLQGFSAFKRFARKQSLIPSNAYPTSMASARFQIWNYKKYMPNTYDYRRVSAGSCCGCMGYNYSSFDRWFSSANVRRALNVCGNAGQASFGGCGAGCITFPKSFDAGETVDNVATIAKLLELKIQVLMVYGMKDTTCNYEGGYAVASALRWKKADLWAKSSLKDLFLNGEVAGKVQSGGGLTWMQIEEAGHMNPADNPRAALFAFNKLFDDLDLTEASSHGIFQTKDEDFMPSQRIGRQDLGTWRITTLLLGLFFTLVLLIAVRSMVWRGFVLGQLDFQSVDSRELELQELTDGLTRVESDAI